MTRNQIAHEIRNIGMHWSVALANMMVAHELVRQWPNDLTACANKIKESIHAFESHRLQVAALINKTDPEDHDTTSLHLLAGDLDKLITDGNALTLRVLRVRDDVKPCQDMGAHIDIIRLADDIGRLRDLAESVQARARYFDFRITSTKELLHA